MDNLLYPVKVKNSFIFNPTSRDFIVDEIPLYEFSGHGEHLVLNIRKKAITAWELITDLVKYLKKLEIENVEIFVIIFLLSEIKNKIEEKTDSSFYESLLNMWLKEIE